MERSDAGTALRPSAGSGVGYALQRAYVRMMMWLVGRLLQAAAAVDPVVAREVGNLEEGFSFTMRVRDTDLGFAMRVASARLRMVSLSSLGEPRLSFDYKHLTHAFLVLGFVEGTARSFANDRMSVDGEIAAAMKIVRCLNRMEAVVLPKLVARRALKEYPAIGLAEKVTMALKIYLKMIVQLFGGK